MGKVFYEDPSARVLKDEMDRIQMKRREKGIPVRKEPI